MPIEKAFAINASPHVIYATLERELRDASEFNGDTHEILRRDPGKSLELRVTIGGVPCFLTYRLEPRDAHTEVIAQLQPHGWRYTFFRIITLGMRDDGFQIALVEGLANLKAEVEQEPSEFPDEEGVLVSAPDE